MASIIYDPSEQETFDMAKVLQTSKLQICRRFDQPALDVETLRKAGQSKLRSQMSFLSERFESENVSPNTASDLSSHLLIKLSVHKDGHLERVLVREAKNDDEVIKFFSDQKVKLLQDSSYEAKYNRRASSKMSSQISEQDRPPGVSEIGRSSSSNVLLSGLQSAAEGRDIVSSAALTVDETSLSEEIKASCSAGSLRGDPRKVGHGVKSDVMQESDATFEAETEISDSLLISNTFKKSQERTEKLTRSSNSRSESISVVHGAELSTESCFVKRGTLKSSETSSSKKQSKEANEDKLIHREGLKRLEEALYTRRHPRRPESRDGSVMEKMAGVGKSLPCSILSPAQCGASSSQTCLTANNVAAVSCSSSVNTKLHRREVALFHGTPLINFADPFPPRIIAPFTRNYALAANAEPVEDPRKVSHGQALSKWIDLPLPLFHASHRLTGADQCQFSPSVMSDASDVASCHDGSHSGQLSVRNTFHSLERPMQTSNASVVCDLKKLLVNSAGFSPPGTEETVSAVDTSSCVDQLTGLLNVMRATVPGFGVDPAIEKLDHVVQNLIEKLSQTVGQTDCKDAAERLSNIRGLFDQLQMLSVDEKAGFGMKLTMDNIEMIKESIYQNECSSINTILDSNRPDVVNEEDHSVEVLTNNRDIPPPRDSTIAVRDDSSMDEVNRSSVNGAVCRGRSNPPHDVAKLLNECAIESQPNLTTKVTLKDRVMKSDENALQSSSSSSSSSCFTDRSDRTSVTPRQTLPVNSSLSTDQRHSATMGLQQQSGRENFSSLSEKTLTERNDEDVQPRAELEEQSGLERGDQCKAKQVEQIAVEPSAEQGVSTVSGLATLDEYMSDGEINSPLSRESTTQRRKERGYKNTLRQLREARRNEEKAKKLVRKIIRRIDCSISAQNRNEANVILSRLRKRCLRYLAARGGLRNVASVGQSSSLESLIETD